MTSLPVARRRARLSVGLVAVLVGLIAAFVAVLASPGPTPPLYNGLGFPDEPYRWLNPPAGSPRTPPMTQAGGELGIQNGASDSGSFISGEQGPQVSFFADPAAFQVPDGTTGVAVRATAVSPVGGFPSGTTVVSNVYRFTATPVGASGTLDFADGKKYLLNMRANIATDRVVLLHRWDGGQWVQRATFQVGTEIYAGTVNVLGDYVLLKMAPGTAISVQHSDPSPLPSTSAPASATQAGGTTPTRGGGGGATVRPTAGATGRPTAGTQTVTATSRTASATASVTATTTSGSPSASASTSGSAAADPSDVALGSDDEAAAVSGLVNQPSGSGGGAVWWVVAAVAALLGGGLAALRWRLSHRGSGTSQRTNGAHSDHR